MLPQGEHMSRVYGKMCSLILVKPARLPSIGVILVCPLASGARVVFPKVKNSLLDRVFCPTILKIDKITTPIFIMHGTNDEVINICNGHDLYEACRPQHPLPPVWVEGAVC
jgi:hypothetical protein